MAGIPAFYSPVGYGTDLAKNKETRNFNGRPCILEEALTGDIALIRGDLADQYGNINFRFSQMNFGPAMATACEITIAEVRETVEEPLNYKDIQLPSVYVNAVVAVGTEL